MRSVTAGMAAPEQGDGTPARTPGGTPSDLSVTALILAIAGAPSAVTGTFGGLVLVAAAATSLRQALPCGRMEGRTAGGLRDG